MLGLTLSDIAARQADWLVARQKIISENIANSDTPGFHARDVRPFSEVLQQTSLDVAMTSPAHLGSGAPQAPTLSAYESHSWDIKHSGNSVSLDEQLLKANEVRSAYSLNVGVIRAFNRMVLASVKS